MQGRDGERGEGLSFGVLQNFRCCTFHDGDTRVGGTQIDTNDVSLDFTAGALRYIFRIARRSAASMVRRGGEDRRGDLPLVAETLRLDGSLDESRCN